MPAFSVPILMYHEVSPQPRPAFRKYTVTPQALAAHMRWLKFCGYQAITPDDLLAARAGHRSLPRRPVLITFDDGLAESVAHAGPILQARGLTAVFYIVAGLVGGRSQWLIAERGVDLPLADWAAVRRLEARGQVVGAHSLTHPHLAEVDPETCRQELTHSRRCLEDELGHTVTHLAYPYGSYNEQVRSLAGECGYRTACSVRIGLSTPDDDGLALHRIPVLGQDSFLDFVSRLRTALPWRASLGRALAARQRKPSDAD